MKIDVAKVRAFATAGDARELVQVDRGLLAALADLALGAKPAPEKRT